MGLWAKTTAQPMQCSAPSPPGPGLLFMPAFHVLAMRSSKAFLLQTGGGSDFQATEAPLAWWKSHTGLLTSPYPPWRRSILVGFCFSCHFFFVDSQIIGFYIIFAQEQPLLTSSGAIARFCVLWHYLLFWSPSRAETRVRSLYIFHLVRNIWSFAIKAGLLKGNWGHI